MKFLAGCTGSHYWSNWTALPAHWWKLQGVSHKKANFWNSDQIQTRGIHGRNWKFDGHYKTTTKQMMWNCNNTGSTGLGLHKR